MDPVLAAGPTSSLICFYSDDPRPQRVIREPLNGHIGCWAISRCLFSTQITIFKWGQELGATSTLTSA